MTDSCGCPSQAGNVVCDLPAKDIQRTARAVNTCPKCGRIGKPVQGVTVKAMLAVSLRAMEDTNYLFCRTQTCRIVYFSAVTDTTFSVEHLRERVYQKEPEANNISICYCFRHTAEELRTASSAERAAILQDIKNGIRDGQCACDLRNPQGSCCLGNVQTMLRRLEAQPIGTG